jgi:hypothetical protein
MACARASFSCTKLFDHGWHSEAVEQQTSCPKARSFSEVYRQTEVVSLPNLDLETVRV